MVHNHQEHVTDNAIRDASATVLLTMKHSMHLMDLSTLLDRLAPFLPPEQRDPMVKMSQGLVNQSSAFSGAVSNFAANWNAADRESFRHAAKDMHTLYDSGLTAVCTARAASEVLTGKLDTVRDNLAENVRQGLDAVHADEMSLVPECTSERAIKLLQKQTHPAGVSR
jgi:hypothetical protein